MLLILYEPFMVAPREVFISRTIKIFCEVIKGKGESSGRPYFEIVVSVQKALLDKLVVFVKKLET